MLMTYLYQDSTGRYHSAPNTSDEEKYLTCTWLSPDPDNYLYNMRTKQCVYSPIIIYPCDLPDWIEKDINN